MQQSSVAQTRYARAPVWIATIWLLLHRDEQYLKLASNHFVAINLEAPDLAAKHRAGLFPPAEWEVGAVADSRKGLEEIRSALVSAFAKLVGIMVFAVFVLWFFGKISPEFPWAYSKVLSLVGGFLAAWATVFELGGSGAAGKATHSTS